MNIEHLYEIFLECGNVTTDSRSKNDGLLFFALKGENFNGNDYAMDALARGCKYAVVDDVKYENTRNCIYVKNTLETLQRLANYHRKKLGITVIGITGTNGKTTTKELVNAVLSKTTSTIATKGNLNNHIGVPLTLLSITQEHKFAVVEMGANHPHEIKELCDIAEPDYGIITSIGKAHLEGFGSFENIITTKKELYDSVNISKGTLFVNGDDSLLLSLSANSRRVLFGSSDHCEVKGWFIDSNPFACFSLLEASFVVHSQLIGSYNFHNLMAASCVGIHFGVPREKIKEALEDYRPENNRSQIKQTEKNTLLLDAYNANPSSMLASVKNFGSMRIDNKIVILGEMLELGTESEKEHSSIIELLQHFDFKAIHLVGQWPRNQLSNKTVVHDNTEALIEYLKETTLTNNTILIKGSRGNRLERIESFV